MTRLFADISVSCNGIVTGPDPSPDNDQGAGEEPLPTWAPSGDPDGSQDLRRLPVIP
ncbi:hypothetical protein GCM10010216_54780 [Streptomyces flaveolus]|nr:hypothetical protein GCM10010216_54780 [Streptomyces flaveolus]